MLSITEQMEQFLGNDRCPVVTLASLQSQLTNRVESAYSGVRMNSAGGEILEKLLSWTRLGYWEMVEMIARQHPEDHRIGVLRAYVLSKLGQQFQAAELAKSNVLQVERTAARDAPTDTSLALFSELASPDCNNLMARTLEAVALFESNESQKGLNGLFQLYEELEPSGEGNGWLQQVVHLLVPCLVASGQQITALKMCKEFCERPENLDNMDAWLGLGKLYLQLGNAAAAQKVLKYIKERCSSPSDDRLLLFEGLVLFALADYPNAMSKFEIVVRSCTSSRGHEFTPQRNKLLIPCDGKATVHLEALNNLAVCALHGYQLERAVECLENAIRTSPYQMVHPVTVFNLCTLYDLARPDLIAQSSKQVILEVAKHYGISNRISAVDLRLA